MKNNFWISIVGILSGLLILFLPDNGKRFFSFNKDHGPSFQDVIGLVLIISVWIYWLKSIAEQRRKVYSTLKIQGVIILICMLIAGLVLIVIGLKNEKDQFLYIGIGLSILGYLLPAIIAFRRN